MLYLILDIFREVTRITGYMELSHLLLDISSHISYWIYLDVKIIMLVIARQTISKHRCISGYNIDNNNLITPSGDWYMLIYLPVLSFSSSHAWTPWPLLCIVSLPYSSTSTSILLPSLDFYFNSLPLYQHKLSYSSLISIWSLLTLLYIYLNELTPSHITSVLISLKKHWYVTYVYVT